MKPQFSLRMIFVAMTALCVVFAIWCSFESPSDEYRISQPIDPFPKVSEIQRMTAFVYQGVANVPKFDVPPKHWGNIRSAMLPAELDRAEVIAKWQVLGHVKILTQDGREIAVDLYIVNLSSVVEVGAFSIAGTYYRGGNSQALLTAIQKAYTAQLATPNASVAVEHEQEHDKSN